MIAITAMIAKIAIIHRGQPGPKRVDRLLGSTPKIMAIWHFWQFWQSSSGNNSLNPSI
jgi:hypothetical protein